MNYGVTKKVVMVENGEPKAVFVSTSDAARKVGVTTTTMTNRIKRGAVVDGALFRYTTAEDDLSSLPTLSVPVGSEQVVNVKRKKRKESSPTPKPFKSDDVELNREKYRIMPYEVRDKRVCITPCPLREPPRPKIGSVECMRCPSNKGRNRKTHEVACNRVAFK